ncbi:3-dehydroquinate synthase [Prochlorococcus marinus]|uniref:3-dehydroquinate synthase n=1 Tax=Prochlorococcus marinus TaxID=1219 RepID=UPI0022B478E4|nr:3-dehydroquinate synthase [Prochlorococcus marinus]
MYQDINRIKVNLTNTPYDVVISAGGIKTIGEELLRIGIRPKTKILIVSNPDVAKPYSSALIKSLEQSNLKSNLLIIEAGEQHKTPQTIAKIHNAAYEHEIERDSLIIALGGGVIGDMAGFAAATWLRGIAFVQVPTTLLAMVDASIGGKTGVNHKFGKNLIGAFHQPKLVLIDINTLQTLPNREFSAGMAEVIKYGVIGDKELFKKLELISSLRCLGDINEKQLLEIITKSVKIKSKIVVEDELEKGLRAILNYGHTFGHVIENLFGYGTWLHGEAVALGMILIGELSLKRNQWESSQVERQKLLIEKAGLPIEYPKLDIEKVIRVLKSDKKVKDGCVRFIMPVKIGTVYIETNITYIEIEEFLREINSI